MKRKRKKGLSAGIKAVLIIIIIICAGVLAFSAYKIIGIQKSYSDAENYYTGIEHLITEGAISNNSSIVVNKPINLLTVDRDIHNSKESKAVKTINGKPVDMVYPEVKKNPGGLINTVLTKYKALVDWHIVSPVLQRQMKLEDILSKHASINWSYEAFHNICEDAEGYIYQEGTLSYPVVQAEDNDKYLRHFIDGTYNVAGTIFVDSNYEDGLESQYAVVYGHNMDDKSMFGTITSYKDEAYYKEHPYFEIYTREGQYVYYVYAAGQVGVDDDVFSYGLTEEKFFELMDELKTLRNYEMNPPVHINKNSKVLVLSTCIDYPRDYNYRYIVVIVRGEPLLDKVDENKTK